MSGPIVLVLRFLMAAAFYAFLGTALWIMWQDIRLAARRAPALPVPIIQLEVRSQRRQPILRAFSQPEVVIGRSALADLRLPGREVSTRHALLRYERGQWWLNDLGSTNGTKLNREKVKTPTVLMTGDEFRCGHTHILVSIQQQYAQQTSVPSREVSDAG